MLTQEIQEQVSRRLHELYERHRSVEAQEVVKYYDTNLSEEEKERFGICLTSVDGEVFHAGDHDLAFPLQSISKAFVYGQALEDRGREYVLQRVGVEPSGEAFNSIQFEENQNRPYNPMVNAGALATTDIVKGDSAEERMERILTTLRRYSGNEDLHVDEAVFAEQLLSTDRNRAIAYLMRSVGMVGYEVEETLELYLKQCSVRVTCQDLAMMAATLANGGVNPRTGERALSARYVRDLLSVMLTCGMYDFAGQWAFQVGIPAKSVVSGGIFAVIPGKLGLAVFSPGLDDHGNSVRGIKVCEEISERLGLHVFATESDDALLRPDEAEHRHRMRRMSDQFPNLALLDSEIFIRQD